MNPLGISDLKLIRKDKGYLHLYLENTTILRLVKYIFYTIFYILRKKYFIAKSQTNEKWGFFKSTHS
jgi:hypothetical protein